MVKGETGVSTKIPFSDSVALKVIKAGTITGADVCGICGKSVNVENYPEDKKPVCKKCMQEIYDTVKEAGGNLK
jgi:formylmethanofuran dehydrogenase subunit E